MRALVVAVACLLLLLPAATGGSGEHACRRRRPRARRACEPGHRADRTRVVDAEDQGRRRHPAGSSPVCSEAELNLRVAQRLRPLLERAGVRVVMTRTTTAGASMGNVARARIANRAGAALFLRIHADGSTDRSVRGTHIALPGSAAGAGRTTSTQRASALRASSSREVRSALGFPDRGLQERSDFTGFNWSNVPVILVELGFMTNPTEDRLLATRGLSAARRGGSLSRNAALPRALGRVLLDPSYRQSTETTSIGSSKPRSDSGRGSESLKAVPTPSSVSRLTRISAAPAAAPMRAATWTPWPP